MVSARGFEGHGPHDVTLLSPGVAEQARNPLSAAGAKGRKDDDESDSFPSRAYDQYFRHSTDRLLCHNTPSP
jgi:hypothetical protein